LTAGKSYKNSHREGIHVLISNSPRKRREETKDKNVNQIQSEKEKELRPHERSAIKKMREINSQSVIIENVEKKELR
jgi:hypothetical protein